jgi:phosphate transport system permease protein
VATTTRSLTTADFKGDRRRVGAERRMRWLFFAASAISVIISALIVFVLLRGAINFLRLIDLGQLTDTGWFPRRERFDISTLIVGSIVIGAISMIVALPFGLGTAIYLAEYARPKVRNVVKPIIEVLAGIPSVVVGYFALKFIAPDIVGPLLNPTTTQNMLVAGLGIGILVIPIMATISEDALRSVPQSLREASFGIGAQKSTTVVKVVLPAAVSGIVAAFIIATSRAIGETLVATMAGGRDGSGPFTFRPTEPGLTMTAAMTNAAGGTDQVQAGAAFEALYFVGLLLFFITLGLNLIGDRFVRRVRHSY